MVEKIPATTEFDSHQSFPQDIPDPKFKVGDRVQWHPLPAREFGTISGLEYAPVPQLQVWSWRYVVQLDPQSQSYGWATTDTAWELDLELISSATANTPTEEIEP